MDFSTDFDDVDSPRTADHDDIDFDINTPRDSSSVDISKDCPVSGEHDSEIHVPSIVITEPSSANLVDLEDDFVTEKQTVNDDTKEAQAISSAEELDFQAEVEIETAPSPGNQTKSDDLNSEFVPDEVIECQNKDLQGSENDKAEITENKSTAIKQDTEIEVNAVAGSSNDTNNVGVDTAPVDMAGETAVDMAEEKNVPEKLMDLQMSQSANMEDEVTDEVTNEVDETVSLDNIMMKDKIEHDSDDEFDFELPAAPSTGTPSQQPTAQTDVTQGQSKPQESAITAMPSVATEKQGINTGSPTPMASSSSTQKPVPSSSQDNYAGSPTPQASSSSTQKPVAVIKPTAQAPYIVQPPPDEGTQRVLEAAQAEWDKVTTIQAGCKGTDTGVQGTEPTVVQTVKPMSPHELLQIFRQDDFHAVRSAIKPAIERHGFAAFVNFLFGPPKLHRDLIEERDVVFCIAASQLSNDNSSHIRTLQTIYRCLTGSKFDCPRIGSHWEEIGFQGTDPATDLRGAGLLGLMNLLHLLKDPKKYQLASDIYKLSLHPTQNFPFCVMGINLSRITLQTLREGLLNKECNRRHEVISVVNDFYVGLYLQMYKVWKGQGKTISDSGYVIKDIEMRAKKSPRDVFRSLDEYLNKKTVVIAEKSTELGGDNFVNVCDDTT